MTNLQSSLDYIDNVLKSSTIEAVWELHIVKMAEFGFDRVLYGSNRFRTHGEFGDLSDAIILTNHDKTYIECFFDEMLYFNAPMAIWAARNTGACSWQWVVDRRAAGETSEKENQILDFNKSMGVVAGYSISFNQISKRSKSAIGLVAKRQTTQKEVDALWEKKGSEIMILNNVMNQKILSLPPLQRDNQLTSRQREVLQWVADGKTMQDIAMIMDLKQPTIEKHLRLARHKLKAETTAQAVLKASVQNQFFIFDAAPVAQSIAN